MYAVVDLETTGGDPSSEGIIEIAICIHNGQEITHSYSTLVNPGKSIPPFISRLTGINDEMVEQAPSFSEIAGEVVNILGDHVFVAHNAPFDYAFIVSALARYGFTYNKEVLCTCRTGRKLIPGHASYSLGKLCRSLNIELNNAHRAHADATATTHLLKMLLEKSGGDLQPYYTPKLVNRSKIPDNVIDGLPLKAGLLYILDENQNIIYLTKASNIRKKAVSILVKSANRRNKNIANLGVSLDFEVTGSLMVAAILEFEAVKNLKPKFNRDFQSYETRFGIYDEPDDKGYITFKTARLDTNITPLVTFHGEHEARQVLQNTCDRFRLSQALCGFTTEIPIHLQPLPEDYNSNASEAIKELRGLQKNFIILDRGPEHGKASAIMVKDARYFGYGIIDTGMISGDVDALRENIRPSSDQPALFKTITRYISQGKYERIISC